MTFLSWNSSIKIKHGHISWLLIAMKTWNKRSTGISVFLLREREIGGWESKNRNRKAEVEGKGDVVSSKIESKLKSENWWEITSICLFNLVTAIKEMWKERWHNRTTLIQTMNFTQSPPPLKHVKSTYMRATFINLYCCMTGDIYK